LHHLATFDGVKEPSCVAYAKNIVAAAGSTGVTFWELSDPVRTFYDASMRSYFVFNTKISWFLPISSVQRTVLTTVSARDTASSLALNENATFLALVASKSIHVLGVAQNAGYCLANDSDPGGSC
jgi:hypothetical protein